MINVINEKALEKLLNSENMILTCDCDCDGGGGGDYNCDVASVTGVRGGSSSC